MKARLSCFFRNRQLTVHEVKCVPNKAKIGRTYRGEAAQILKAFEALSPDQSLKIKEELANSGYVS